MPLQVVYTTMNLGSVTIYYSDNINQVIVNGTLVDADGLLPNAYNRPFPLSTSAKAKLNAFLKDLTDAIEDSLDIVIP